MEHLRVAAGMEKVAVDLLVEVKTVETEARAATVEAMVEKAGAAVWVVEMMGLPAVTVENRSPSLVPE